MGLGMTTDIAAKLAYSRKELLDLGLRNPLINFRVRAKKIEVVDEISEEVFRLLVTEGKKMTFLPIPKKLEEKDDEGLADLFGGEDEDWAQFFGEDGEEASNGPASRHTDTRLQTRLATESLHARLLTMYRGAKTYIDEQGVNTLYLALGFLHWREAKSSDIDRRAPLLLIPAELVRLSAKDRFKLCFTEDDIGQNLSLAEKLSTEFAIELPKLDVSDGFSPTQYFKKVARAVAGHPDWSVAENEICLGFFSFGKLLMFKDLDPDSWPEGSKPSEHEIVATLLGDGFREPATELMDDASVDEAVNVSDMFLVKDADSSQILAIHDINNGQDMVIQGPPGTGKSQTITNVIAELIGNGKKVLFVAEKMAALEVVKRRLDVIGLGDAALELHSHKTRKKEVLEELDRTLGLGKPVAPDGSDDVEQLISFRDRLNEYALAVNQPVGETGVTPVAAVGKFLGLGPDAVKLACMDYGQMKDWARADYRRKRVLVEQMQRHLQDAGLPSGNPFWGSKRTVFLPTDEIKIKTVLQAALLETEKLKQLASNLANTLHLPQPGTAVDIEVTCDAAHRATEAPHLDGVSIKSQSWQLKRDDLKHLIECGESLTALHSRYEALLIPGAWDQEVMDIREAFAVYGHKWWRMLSSKYRSGRNRLAALCKDVPPKGKAASLDVVDAILEAQREQEVFDRHRRLGSDLFGAQWEDELSNWAVLKRIASWIIDLYDDVGNGRIHSGLIGFLSGTPQASEVSASMGAVDKQLAIQRKVVDELIAELEATGAEHDSVTFVIDSRFARRTLDDQIGSVHSWIENLNQLRSLVNYNILAKEMQEQGIGFVLRLTHSWRLAKSALVDAFDATWYNGILERAFHEREPLKSFSRSAHEFAITKFRELDRMFLENNRSILAQKHWDSMPHIGGHGELAIIKKEINKKRRHLPIRRLIGEAGRAIQAIKPVFMMSPMSIATYIPPGALEFDLVVFDEASQVKPIDAFGAILRGKQAVVVGDDMQLPPTDFFQSLAGNVDDDTDEEMTETGDMESVLTLFAGKNAPQRMLRWHYRSEHESLIAVSNYEFYDHKLVLFPSPRSNVDAPGLQFIHLPTTYYDRGKSRTNPGEAKAVAIEVMRHAKKKPDVSLGVVAFSSAQRDAIDFQLELLRRRDPSCEDFFAEGKHEPFFVKNLENVQGDERDYIFISIGYGKTQEGYFAMGFGPLNREGGERRLNVLVTRARKCCRVFANFDANDLDLNRTSARGVAALKTYLKFAKTQILDVPTPVGGEADSPFEEEVARSLVSLGYEIDLQVGSGGFRVDLGVVDPQKPGRYVLGIECDGATYHSARSARDRDRLREEVLKRLGWRIHRIWSTDWFLDREKEIRRTVEAIEQAKLAVQGEETKRNVGPVEVVTSAPKIERTEVRKHEHEDFIETKPYEKASFAIRLGRRQLHELGTMTLASHAANVVHVESPVHVDEVIHRIVELAGLKRAGSRIQKAVMTAILSASRRGEIKKKRDFLWTSDEIDVDVRDRSQLESGSRKYEYIPQEELLEALCQIVQSSYSVRKDILAAEAFRLLGFQRVTGKAQSVFDKALRKGLKDEMFVERDGLIVAEW